MDNKETQPVESISQYFLKLKYDLVENKAKLEFNFEIWSNLLYISSNLTTDSFI